MLKEAIEKIVSLAAPTIREIEGSVFRITQDGDVSEIHPKPGLDKKRFRCRKNKNRRSPACRPEGGKGNLRQAYCRAWKEKSQAW